MRSNNKIQLLLIVLVLALGLGYAYINSDLNINGTAQVNSANWDVHWANVAVTSGSVSASSPTISNQTTVNYSVILNTPGDYYEFTVDAVNGGSIDAMIDTISSKLNGATITTLPAYLKYSVTYADGIELAPNHKLLHNTSEKYKIRIEYNDDIELNQIPASNQTLSLQLTVTYRQITDDSIDRPVVRYTVNGTKVYTRQTIPNGVTLYTTASAAMSAFSNRVFYLKHIISDNRAVESYVEFIVTTEKASSVPGMTTGTHVLKGGIDESALSSKPIFDANKATLLKAFGSSHCTVTAAIVSCTTSGSLDTQLGAIIYTNGTVRAGNGNYHCIIDNYGNTYFSCEENYE